MNFFKNLTDSLNYQEIANPFYLKKKYDSKIINISFYHNMVFIRKGNNNKVSKEVINHSYEDMKYLEKSNRTGKKFKYFFTGGVRGGDDHARLGRTEGWRMTGSASTGDGRCMGSRIVSF